MRWLAIGTGVLVVFAAPASAQISGSMRGLSGSPSFRGDILADVPGDAARTQRVAIGRELGGLRDDIHDAREAGQLSRREARALRREGLRIEAVSSRYARGGYSDAETAMLRGRTEALRSAIAAKRTQGLGR
ncbi:hypothetical protein RZN05_09415 [Sphingomonas sp. HF-S4]|uniref:DUF4148 domain-containing protein n=1 Tax=Sphingomonas agrestis TaxID=3080540 RepID=A0ABU3Y7D3_9SPHN|nr:hypothetical protein [Sphingomonas sp. HF-S4]MDV3457199.1 hypothetical protein [Sphingomonas sp. HF-S4]